MTTRGTIANISNSLDAYYRSTDQGVTWTALTYQCPNGPNYLLFADSNHGISFGTAQTDDGGYSWDCQDTTIYAGATQYMMPADFDPSAYYDIAGIHQTNYVCLSTDRGSTWNPLFVYPTNISNRWGLSIRRRLFIALPTKLIWTADFGQTFHTFKFNYGGSVAGNIQRTPDGTLWASNDLELYVSRDTGNTWVNQSENIPYRQDSFQLSYTFQPVDSLIGFVRTSSGSIFRTLDAGLTWQPDSMMPTVTIDARHWFAGSRYTADAGATWRTVANVSLALDSLRWLSPGRYTTDAGITWMRIPGWPQSPAFTVIDSSTAFAGGFPTGSLWRLDMPFFTTPKPAAPDFFVENQIWKNVPLQQDSGWVQRPIVIHNTSLTAPIVVDFDSLSDPTHFYLASYQSVAVTVPKKASLLGPDGLDSVWVIYHPTAIEKDTAKAYWHSPQVTNTDGSTAERTDSLFGNPTAADVSEQSNSSISLIPNPTTGLVTIRGASGAIVVSNVLGEAVLTGNTSADAGSPAGERVLDLGKLPPGTYYARFRTAGRASSYEKSSGNNNSLQMRPEPHPIHFLRNAFA